MRNNYIIDKLRAKLWLLVSLLLLVSCSEDADDSRATVDDEGEMLQLGVIGQAKSEVISSTRSVTVPDNYSEYTGSSVIGVFMTYESTAPTTVSTFTYTTSGWRSLVNIKQPYYYIYGFMPANIGTCEILPFPGGFADGATLKFYQLRTVSAEDLCVITGVQDTDKDNAITDAASMKRGTFGYRSKEKGNNYVNLMLDHLYAGFVFKMKVDAGYNELRTIKLKEMTLIMKNNAYASINASVTLTPNETGADPVTSIVWTTNYDTEDEVVLFTDDEGFALSSAEPKEINGYFTPVSTVESNLSIRCTYNVYDKSENLIREGCVAENNLPTQALNRGERKVLTLTVNPTYLYVLSEPDLENPTITISN